MYMYKCIQMGPYFLLSDSLADTLIEYTVCNGDGILQVIKYIMII